MARSCLLNGVEWLTGNSICLVPGSGGGRCHPQAREAKNLWCLLPSSFWLKTKESEAPEGGEGH